MIILLTIKFPRGKASSCHISAELSYRGVGARMAEVRVMDQSKNKTTFKGFFTGTPDFPLLQFGIPRPSTLNISNDEASMLMNPFKQRALQTKP